MLPPRRSLAAAPGRRPATLFPSMCECFVPHTSHWSDRKSPFPPSRLQSFSAWFSHFIFCFISRSSSFFYFSHQFSHIWKLVEQESFDFLRRILSNPLLPPTLSLYLRRTKKPLPDSCNVLPARQTIKITFLSVCPAACHRFCIGFASVSQYLHFMVRFSSQIPLMIENIKGQHPFFIIYSFSFAGIGYPLPALLLYGVPFI